MNDNNTAVSSALRDIVASYGVAVLADITRINALLKDYIPRQEKERKLLLLALREGLGAELQSCASSGGNNREYIEEKWRRRLVSDSWITEEAARLVVGQLCDAAGIRRRGAPPYGGSKRDGSRPENGGAELIKGVHDELEDPNGYLSRYQIIGYKAFASNPALRNITISDTIRIIRPKAFYNCVNLRSVQIPSGIEAIGRYAFKGCASLNHILIPRSKNYSCDKGLLVHAASHALMRAVRSDETEDVTVPNDVLTIQAYAFSDSRSRRVTLPGRLTTIESAAFDHCLSLESFAVSAANPYFKSVEGVLHSGDNRVLLRYPAGAARSSYILEDGVTEIARSAFAESVNLEAVTFPGSLLRIGERAFSGCGGIRSVILPITVESIGERAFQGCTQLSHFMLPRGIREIGDFAFSGCEKLETLSIPRGVVRIGNRAFSGCGQLRRIVIQDNVSFIGDGAFDCCAEGLEIAVRNNPYAEAYCRVRSMNVTKI